MTRSHFADKDNEAERLSNFFGVTQLVCKGFEIQTRKYGSRGHAFTHSIVSHRAHSAVLLHSSGLRYHWYNSEGNMKFHQGMKHRGKKEESLWGPGTYFCGPMATSLGPQKTVYYCF